MTPSAALERGGTASAAAFRKAKASTWLSLETVVFLAVWLLLLTAGRQRLFQDPGTFWHTAVGQRMMASGEVVRQDPFTFTFAGQEWLAHQWLAECLMALGYRLGGWDTLLLATAALLAALYAWLAGRWQRTGCSTARTVMVLAAVFIASAHHYHVRPHLASIMLLAISVAILCDVESGRSQLARLAWLVPLFALWTNLHGGTLGGLATLGIVVAGWMGARAVGWPSPLSGWRDVALAVGVVLACCATILISPFGVQMPRAWLTIMQLTLPDVIQEHGRLNFRRPEAWMVLLIGLGYAVALWRAPRWRVTSLLPLLWFVLACDRVRHAPLFAVVAAVAGAELIRPTAVSLVPAVRWRTWLPPGLLVLACLTLQAVGLKAPLIGRGWAHLDARLWPVELIDELQHLEQPSQRQPIFNALHLGGFVEFYTPGLATFIDDRCELFGDAFLHQYVEAEQRRPELIDLWQQQYQFQHALVLANSPLDDYLAQNPRWITLAPTRAAVLYGYTGDPAGTAHTSQSLSTR